MDLGVHQRRYLIVGGTAGMGLAAAEALAADGAQLVLAGRHADRTQAAADRVSETFSAAGGTAIGVTADVSRPEGGDEVVAAAVAVLGGLDGIAITTGTAPGAHHSLGEATEADWTESFQDVLMGTVRTVRAALPHLVERGGTIVTTAAYSTRAYHPSRLPYVVMKSGVVAFTKTIAKEYGCHSVRANCVCPGAIETGPLQAMRRQLAKDRDVPAEGLLERVMVEEWHMEVALGRPGSASEVGDLFAFLLSPRAGYLTGAVVNIDGGTDF